MKSQVVMSGTRMRDIALSLVIGLMLIASLARWNDKASSKAAEAQTKPSAEQDGNLSRLSQHDIPPEFAIDVGSFKIDTDLKLVGVPKTRKRQYKVDSKDVTMARIKVIRTDDGAVLYQNFAAEAIRLTFFTNSKTDKKITIERATDAKKVVEVVSNETNDLDETNITTTNGRKYRLSKDYNIENVTITSGNQILFFYDQPGGNWDKNYRVLIWIHKH